MAYQKELWISEASIRTEISDILSDADFLDEVDEYDLDSKRVLLQFRLIPSIIDELVEDAENEVFVRKLDYLEELITYDEIGVVLTKKEVEAGVAVEPLKIDERRTSLVIVVSERVLAGLQSCDDRQDLIERFKQVFIQTADDYERLRKEEIFVPYSKV